MLDKSGEKKAIRLRSPGRKIGEKRHLLPEQESRIRTLIIDKCPDRLKLDFALWNRIAVQQLIEQEYEIAISICVVGEYLKRWDWLEDVYPTEAHRAKSEGADINRVDETQFRAFDIRGRRFALRSQIPVVRATTTYRNPSMVSAITNQGKVQRVLMDGTMNSERFIDFLQRLISDASRKVFLVVNKLLVHYCKLVNEWLAEHTQKNELFFLLPYSPDLNPDEHSNADLKYGIGLRGPDKIKEELRNNTESHMHMPGERPERIRKYFENPTISYALF